MSEREPFERNSLRGIRSEQHYMKKMEDIIVAEGKRLLNSLRINYIMIHQKHISKFIDKHPEFKKTVWQQIRIQRLLDTKIISSSQHCLLVMFKQVCNKNSIYVLRGISFKQRYHVLNCDRKVENCLLDDCKASEICPYYFKNTEGKHAKYQRWTKEKYEKKGKIFVEKDD